MKNRQIRKYGDTWVIKLAPIDHKDYNLDEGDMIDLESSLLLHVQDKTIDCLPLPQPCHKLKGNIHNNKKGKKQ